MNVIWVQFKVSLGVMLTLNSWHLSFYRTTEKSSISNILNILYRIYNLYLRIHNNLIFSVLSHIHMVLFLAESQMLNYNMLFSFALSLILSYFAIII